MENKLSAAKRQLQLAALTRCFIEETVVLAFIFLYKRVCVRFSIFFEPPTTSINKRSEAAAANSFAVAASGAR